MTIVVNSMKHIYFVRHGETIWNATGQSQGMETPLNDTGHHQAAVVAERAKGLDIDKLYTSNMIRAVETGSYLAKSLNLEPEESPLFREWMGPDSVRGKKIDSPEYQAYMQAVNNHFSEPKWRYENAENYSDLNQRLAETASLLERESADSILVVSHGKYLRLFLTYILHQKKVSPDVLLTCTNTVLATNTGITLYTFDESGWKLLTWNDHAHFAE